MFMYKKIEKEIGKKIFLKKLNFFLIFFPIFFSIFFFIFFSISQNSICILIFVGLNDCIVDDLQDVPKRQKTVGKWKHWEQITNNNHNDLILPHFEIHR